MQIKMHKNIIFLVFVRIYAGSGKMRYLHFKRINLHDGEIAIK